MWLSLAAERGDAKAREDRDLLSRSMSAKQIEQSQALARRWKPQQR
jgi:hypothetical protein